MNSFLSFLFSLILFSTTQAQNIDSLRKAVVSNDHDTNRVKSLLRLSNSYIDFERDSAMQFAQEALNLSTSNNFEKGEAQSLNIIGSILTGTGNYPMAFEYHLDALKIAEKIKNETLIAAIYNNLARVSTERSDYKTAIEYLFKAKSKFEELDIKEYAATALLNIGDTYERMDKLDSGLHFQNLAYQLALKIDYTYLLGAITSNLGHLYLNTGKITEASDYFQKAISFLRTSNDKSDIEVLAGVYDGISKIFEKKDKTDSALFYAKKSLGLSMQVADQKRILNASMLLNKLYHKEKLIDSAYRYSTIASETRERILSADKVSRLENMKVTEQTRQLELARTEAKIQKVRKSNLQLIGITFFIITFFSILIIVGRRKTYPRALKYLGLLGLLLLFEFIAIFVHPFIDKWTNHDPVYMLIILVAIAAVLVPLHHKMEHWVKEKLAEGKLKPDSHHEKKDQVETQGPLNKKLNIEDSKNKKIK